MQTKSNPTNVVVWTRKSGCPWCDRAKALLRQANISYTEKVLGDLPMEQFLQETNNARTVPQIIFDDTVIGGFEQLQKALASDYTKVTKVV